MNRKTGMSWKKIMLFGLWLAAGACLVLLSVSAMKRRSNEVCKGVDITIRNSRNKPFITEKEIASILLSKQGRIEGRNNAQLDLRAMEITLKTNVWIREAQLYLDNNNWLRVDIKEREPIARIFTKGGRSFFIDSAGIELPLVKPAEARLPVFTSLPVERTRKIDSALLEGIKAISSVLLADSFWMAQIGQIDINKNKEFELVPMAGDQLILFGNGREAEKKFRKLRLFYEKVVKQVGWNKYRQIDLRFRGQVVAAKQPGDTLSYYRTQPAVDSMINMNKQNRP